MFDTLIPIVALAGITLAFFGMLSEFPLSRQARRIARLEAALKEARLKKELLEAEGRGSELDDQRKFPRP